MPSDIDLPSERRSALDSFAARDPNESRGEVTIPQQAFMPGGETIFGAQKVAVYRDEQKVLQKIAALAAAAGSDWYYRYPVRKKIKDPESGKESWGVDYIEGPSIKLANDLARLYGNNDISVREVDVGDGWVFYARFVDFETGSSQTRSYRQSKGAGRIGGRDEYADSRRLDMAYQIGVSKALRNVVKNALQTFADFAMEEAKQAMVERIGKNLDGWRKRVLEKVGGTIDIRRVERVIGRTADKWLAPDIARIVAMWTAIDEGMSALDETFPPLEPGEAGFGTEAAGADAGEGGNATEAAGKGRRRAASKPKGKKAAKDGPEAASPPAAASEPAEGASAPAQGDAGAPDAESGPDTAASDQSPPAAAGEAGTGDAPPTEDALAAAIKGAATSAELEAVWNEQVEPHRQALGGDAPKGSDVPYWRLAKRANLRKPGLDAKAPE